METMGPGRSLFAMMSDRPGHSTSWMAVTLPETQDTSLLSYLQSPLSQTVRAVTMEFLLMANVGEKIATIYATVEM